MDKHKVLWAALLVLGSSVVGYACAAATHEKVIKVTARKFEFIPNEIVLKKGEPVTFEIVTEDVVMGFNAPDLHQRADLLPQQTAHVHFTPDKAGTYPFLCDVFCGTGHEKMTGVIKVVD